MPDSPSQTAGMLSPLQLHHSGTSKGQPAHEKSRTGEYSAWGKKYIKKKSRTRIRILALQQSLDHSEYIL
jgi:hypothetical protein